QKRHVPLHETWRSYATGLTSGLNGSQSPRQVGTNVFQVFQSHRQANQAVVDTGGRAGFWAQTTVRGARRMGNGGFGIPQVGGDGDHAGVVDDPPCRELVALDLETHYRAKTALLPFGQLMLRMAGQPAVVNLGHL